MEFLRRVLVTLARPRRAFADVAAEPRFEEGLLLAACYAATAGVGAMAASAKVTTVVQGAQVPEAMTLAGESVALLAALGAMGMVFVTWLLAAGFARGVSAAFGGRGTFRTLLSVAAYAALPLVAASAASAVLYALSSPYTMTVTVGGFFSVSTEYSSGYYADPYLPWARLLVVVGPAACTPLWAAALREVEGLPLGRAAGALAVLYAIYYGLTLGVAALTGMGAQA